MSKVYLEDSTLTSIADAIRAKTGESGTITPADMATEIGSIPTGGSVTQPLVMTEIKPYTPSSGVDGFSSVTPQLDLVIDAGKVRAINYTGNVYNGNQPIFGVSGITKNLHTIFGDDLSIINSVTILIDPTNIGNEGMTLGYIATREEDQAFFRDKVKFIFRGSATPNKLSTGSSGTGCFISNNPYIETLTENNFDWSDFTFVNDSSSATGTKFQPIFSEMYKLTTIDTSVKNFCFEYFNKAKLGAITSNDMFFNKSYNFRDETFYNALLKKIVDSIQNNNVYTFLHTGSACGISTITIPKKLMPSTNQNCMFNSGSWWALGGGPRLSHVIFEPYTSEDEESDLYRFAKIQIRIICGYTDNIGANYLDSSKRITNNLTYESLKNDPDAWTTDINYSVYNHSSAVETINSLPDMTKNKNTATGLTYTMQFKGALGSATDGGAVNTLTAEEIAVATAKGWTISFY